MKKKYWTDERIGAWLGIVLGVLWIIFTVATR